MSIITSMLDMDWYKFKVSYAAWYHGYHNNLTHYRTISRTPTFKTEHIFNQEELTNLKTIWFTKDELDWLELKFGTIYIDYLIKNKGMATVVNFDTVTGAFPIATLYETLILSTISELYSNLMSEKTTISYCDEFTEKADKKLILLKNSNIKIIEFGTRRRFNKFAQAIIFNKLRTNYPNNLAGTSNTLLNKNFGLTPKGTVPHEWFMFHAALSKATTLQDLINSQKIAIDKWCECYGPDEFILSDTYGSDWFFTHIFHQYENMNIRQDSGNALERLRQINLNYISKSRKDKPAIASDNLDISKCIELDTYFTNKLDLTFGIGTNLTFDCSLKPLSIVNKLTNVDGFATIKISDTPEKAMSENPQLLDKYIKMCKVFK